MKYAVLFLTSFFHFSFLSAATIDLPTIGESSSGIVSTYQEEILGDTWLRLYRNKAPVSYDPIINNYLEQLLIETARYSDLSKQRLSLVLINNSTLNAFAVPGGIIGIHTGLFNYAKTKDQFGAVIAHEMAHLSQRHYARGIEEQRRQQIPNMAALLASLILVATSNGDAGVAALSASQAIAIDQQLRFSRLFEQEADRVGIQTMIRAKMNPHAAADMFENMQRATLYSQRPPEFLLTHPITESRIADAKNRANEHPNKSTPSIDYQLMRARALWLSISNNQEAITLFSNESAPLNAHSYGLALAFTTSKQFDKAEQALTPLLKKHPNNIALVSAYVDILVGKKSYEQALKILDQQLEALPNNYPFSVQKADLLIQTSQPQQAAALISQVSKNRPFDPHVWYLLAEYQGLAGNIPALHSARTEFFLLKAQYDRAENQIRNGLKLAPKNSIERAKLSQKLNELIALRKRAKLS